MTDLQTLQESANRTSDDYLAHKVRELSKSLGGNLTDVEQALLEAAARRLGEDVYPSRCRLEFRPTSKGELIDKLFPGQTVDGALPQAWVDRIRSRLPDEVVMRIAPDGLAFHFCTVYDHNGSTVQPLTRQGIEILAEFVNYVR